MKRNIILLLGIVLTLLAVSPKASAFIPVTTYYSDNTITSVESRSFPINADLEVAYIAHFNIKAMTLHMDLNFVHKSYATYLINMAESITKFNRCTIYTRDGLKLEPKTDLSFEEDDYGFHIRFKCFDPDLSSDYAPDYEHFCDLLWEKDIDRIVLSNGQESFTIPFSEKEYKSNLHLDEVFSSLEERWRQIIAQQQATQTEQNNGTKKAPMSTSIPIKTRYQDNTIMAAEVIATPINVDTKAAYIAAFNIKEMTLRIKIFFSSSPNMPKSISKFNRCTICTRDGMTIEPKTNLKFTTDSNGFLIEFECFDPDLSPDYEPGFGNFSNIMWQKAIDRIILSNDQESFTINYTEDEHKSNLHFDEVFKTIETRWAEIVSE